MTTANFKTRVANYIGRAPSVFVDAATGFDNLLAAINDTRRDAQLMYNWQGLRTPGFININGSAGAPWSTPSAAAPHYGPFHDYALSQPMTLKMIDSVWNYTLDTNNVPLRTNRIDFGTEQQFKHLLPTNSGYPFTQNYPGNPPFFYNTIPSARMFAYVIGPQFYVNTSSLLGYPQSTNQFMIVGLQMLGDLLGTETTDFFLGNYQTWCLLQTVMNLNNYVKEDQRVQVGQKSLSDAWNATPLSPISRSSLNRFSAIR